MKSSRPHEARAEALRWAGLLLALAGFWAPWLARPAAALQLNAYELSEWLTFLPAAQLGSLAVDRLSFLLPSACLASLFALAAAAGPRAGRGLAALLPGTWLSWLWLGLAGLCALAVFPYYPYILSAYADPEFRLQFWVAAGTVMAVGAVQVLQDDGAALAQGLLGLAGLVLTVRALAGLWPAAHEVLSGWSVGWGAVAAALGFAGLLADGWRRLFQPRR